MEIKTVNRTIHPDTHKSENPYRVKIGKRDYYDKLIVNIHHYKKGYIATHTFEGEDIAPFESIHFKADEMNGQVNIHWMQNIQFSKRGTNE